MLLRTDSELVESCYGHHGHCGQILTGLARHCAWQQVEMTVSCKLQGEDGLLNGQRSAMKGTLSCLAYAQAPYTKNPAVRVSLSPLVAIEMLRNLGHVDYEYSGIIKKLMGQDMTGQKSDAQMWAMKLEGYGLQGRMSVGLQELMRGVALPETISDIAFLVPQSHLTLSKAQPSNLPETATQLISLVRQVQHASLVSMQPVKPYPWSGRMRLGTEGLGKKGMLSMLVLLDEQQMPWTFFIHAQQPADSTVTTAKEVVCSLEDDLSGFSTLPQLSPTWRNWHRGSDDIPTVPMRANTAAAAKQRTKLPFNRVVYIYILNNTLSPSEQSTLRQVVAAGHPWLQRTVIHTSSIRTDYFRRTTGFSNDALRHAILSKLR